jgi:predicted nucleic acid-binding protein
VPQAVACGTVTDERFAAAIDDLTQLDLERYPTLRFMRRVFELRANVTAYDSAYLALAEELGCELLTADQRLASATGPRCIIQVLR